jgi:hypothetical protein
MKTHVFPVRAKKQNNTINIIITVLRKGWHLPNYSGDIHLNPKIIKKPNCSDLASEFR